VRGGGDWKHADKTAMRLSSTLPVAESFFHSIKTELVNHQHYKTREEAKQSIFEYMEIFYNRQRLHSYCQYLSPMQFEENMQ
jgi:transposase InsO family protein